jgi:hypothetical protein
MFNIARCPPKTGSRHHSGPFIDMHDFLISVASGLTVAILSAIFLRARPAKTGPSQNMTMNAPRSRSVIWILFLFLIGFAAALTLLQLK